MTKPAPWNINFLAFAHGILCGIAALGTERFKTNLLGSWDFLGLRGHVAAEAAYQYLQLRPDCQLWFEINRDPIDGESNVWGDGIRFEWEHDTIRPFSPLGSQSTYDFFVDPTYNSFEILGMSSEEREMWIDCAWVFANAYGRFRD